MVGPVSNQEGSCQAVDQGTIKAPAWAWGVSKLHHRLAITGNRKTINPNPGLVMVWPAVKLSDRAPVVAY